MFPLKLKLLSLMCRSTDKNDSKLFFLFLLVCFFSQKIRTNQSLALKKKSGKESMDLCLLDGTLCPLVAAHCKWLCERSSSNKVLPVKGRNWKHAKQQQQQQQQLLIEVDSKNQILSIMKHNGHIMRDFIFSQKTKLFKVYKKNIIDRNTTF